MSTPRYTVDDFNDTPGHLVHELTDSWQPYYLSGVDDTPPQPPSLGHNLIYPGVRHVFSGPQESAKTLVAYDCGLNIIRNHPGAQILVMDFEMGPRGAKRRWRDLGATDHELDQQILYIAPSVPARIERIEILVAIRPVLVIIDAAAGAFDNENLDDTKRMDAERWRKLYVDPFFDAGIATLVLDHVVKNTEARGKYAIGSERKVAGTEVHIGFDTIKSVKRGSNGIYKMSIHKDREGFHQRGHFMDALVNSDPETHTLTIEYRPVEQPEPGTQWLPTIYMERVSNYLHANGTCSRTHLEQNVEGGSDRIRQAIEALVAHQFVTWTAGPRNSRNYTLQRPFVEAQWKAEHPPARPATLLDKPEAGSGGVKSDSHNVDPRENGQNKPNTLFKSSPPDPASTPPRRSDLDPASHASPYGDAGGSHAAKTGSPRQAGSNNHNDDPEVIAMLAHYDLLEPPPDPPADLYDPNPDIPH